MANNQIEMRKIKRIFKLYTQGVSKRKISTQLAKNGQSEPLKTEIFEPLKTLSSLGYKRIYNNYCYAHFYPLKVVHFDRFLQFMSILPRLALRIAIKTPIFRLFCHKMDIKAIL